jgi:predicted DNA-binding mobile mystery protein A
MHSSFIIQAIAWICANIIQVAAWNNAGKFMNDLDILKLQQLEEAAALFRQVADLPVPKGGWVNAIRTALGLSNVQLARRLRRKASQTIEDMQASEVKGTIKLNTLRELAAALDSRLVYAIVPNKPLDEIRRERAYAVADNLLSAPSHSMELEGQGLTPQQRQRAVDRLAEKLLAGSPRKLWDEHSR